MQELAVKLAYGWCMLVVYTVIIWYQCLRILYFHVFPCLPSDFIDKTPKPARFSFNFGNTLDQRWHTVQIDGAQRKQTEGQKCGLSVLLLFHLLCSTVLGCRSIDRSNYKYRRYDSDMNLDIFTLVHSKSRPSTSFNSGHAELQCTMHLDAPRCTEAIAFQKKLAHWKPKI